MEKVIENLEEACTKLEGVFSSAEVAMINEEIDTLGDVILKLDYTKEELKKLKTEVDEFYARFEGSKKTE